MHMHVQRRSVEVSSLHLDVHAQRIDMTWIDSRVSDWTDHKRPDSHVRVQGHTEGAT